MTEDRSDIEITRKTIDLKLLIELIFIESFLLLSRLLK